MHRTSLIPLAFVLLAGQMPGASETREEAPAAIEEFLRTAKVVDMVPLGTGVTHSHRATLTDGTTTVHAVWKTIDEYQPIKRFYDGGPPELGFIDSYKNEIAAYELDKLLDLGIVPPTVERRIDRADGSLQLWVEDAITEAERFKRKLTPPEPALWSRNLYTVRLFRQLIYDKDYRNASNILVDRQFRIWSIDHSRAFRLNPELLNSEFLRRFSTRVLERLAELEAAILEERLSAWLSDGQREALLERRDLLLAHARQLVSEKGEAAVLFP